MSCHFTWDPYWGCRRFLDIFKWSTMALRHHQSHSVTNCLIRIALLSTIINYHQHSSTFINIHQLLTINIYTGAIGRFLICVSSGTVWHLRSAAQLQVGVGILYQSLAQTNSQYSQPCYGHAKALRMPCKHVTRHNTSQYSTQNTTEYDRIQQVFWVFWVFWNILGSIWLLFCYGGWFVSPEPLPHHPTAGFPEASSVPHSPLSSRTQWGGPRMATEDVERIGWKLHWKRKMNWMKMDGKWLKIYEHLWSTMKICEDLCRLVWSCMPLWKSIVWL